MGMCEWSVQYLQVETFGSMEREEKVQFILEQMRLGLAKKDYIRTQIISKKISIKFFTSSSESDIVQVSPAYMYTCMGIWGLHVHSTDVNWFYVIDYVDRTDVEFFSLV